MWELAQQAVDVGGDIAADAAYLRDALADFADVLADEFLAQCRGGNTREILEAYRIDQIPPEGPVTGS